MLDDAERASLAETERQLARSDPHLAALLRDGHARRRRVVSVVAWVVWGVASLLVVGLLFLGLGWQALLVATLAGLLLARRRWWLPRRGRP
ncbi:DUF3040 domain-containing protein [Actinomycetospora straminea]|uniref:DUF3040 family protein n=1 Tax=Actinomycetospora straminea TaxID=663607 RepID=A0ABP9FAI5_9PSEU|nr:DUF3040 domain-containing protein [Actinomycetospora straminea]MDD7936573.1 DUF3040 domain-containing protein [Actinomycetospora straminea]